MKSATLSMLCTNIDLQQKQSMIELDRAFSYCIRPCLCFIMLSFLVVDFWVIRHLFRIHTIDFWSPSPRLFLQLHYLLRNGSLGCCLVLPIIWEIFCCVDDLILDKPSNNNNKQETLQVIILTWKTQFYSNRICRIENYCKRNPHNLFAYV